MQIEINDDVARELAYMVRLHQEHGAPAQMDSGNTPTGVGKTSKPRKPRD
ncbi:MAG: hypothetical protein IE935_11525 [Micrococcales bacterium]|nr:hypothetical protein [Micrococcales bacterium]